MCMYPQGRVNGEYLHDLHRGRYSELNRFIRIDDYAYSRWMNARDMRHTRQWYKIMEAVRRRAPLWYGYRSRLEQLPVDYQVTGDRSVNPFLS